MIGKSKSLKIGGVAKRARTSVHTIRYYEKMGLMERPGRSDGGFRLYGRDSVNRLQFIQKAKNLGLSLGEIKRITHCGERGLSPCCEMTVRLFNQKILELESKAKEINRTKRKVRALVSGWAGRKGRP